ncbi:MAG: hypothetical protein PHZ09_13440 [Eubacteriales bacterium]|nr:hypothetical protein [Eubacteriales bacterium]
MKRSIVLITALLFLLATYVSAVENLAPQAEVEAVSSYSAEYDAAFVKDGKIITPDARYPFWVTDYESEAGASITWSSAQSISRAVLYDLPSETENVVSGTLTFSDGTSVNFGVLDPAGAATEVAKFDTPISVTSVTISVKSDEDTLSVGLAEAEFYDANGVNVARSAASATATSVGFDGDSDVWNHEYYTDGWYTPANLFDGYFEVMSYENCEWSSAGDPNPHIMLTWPADIKIGTVVLYDRYNTSDNAIAGTIACGDGTVVDFSGLDPTGRPLYVDIPDVTTSSFTVTVTESESSNIGFGEIEVFTEHYANGAFIVDTPAEVIQPDADPAAPVVVADKPAAPQTADGGIIAVIASVISLAAYAITKKEILLNK